MRIEKGAVTRIEGASEELIRHCKATYKVPNPEYERKVRMGLWLGNTPKELHLCEYKKDTIIAPVGLTMKLRDDAYRLNKKRIWIDYLKTDADYEKVDFGGKVELFPYQEDAIEEMLCEYQGILIAPAGSGKTQMGIAMCQELGGRALWITHTKDLLTQSKERAARYFDKSKFGEISEGKVEIGETMTFATIQTLNKCDISQFADEFKTVIVDECHRVSGSPTHLTMYAGVLNRLNSRYRYGLTATEHRSDGLWPCATALLGEPIWRVPKEVVESRVMKVRVQPFPTGWNPEAVWQVTSSDGMLNYTKLVSTLSECDYRNWMICGLIRDCIEGHSILVLSDRLKQLEFIQEQLADERVRMVSGHMTSKKAKAEREEIIEGMRTGKYKVLLATYQLAKEGLDIPCLDRLIMATPVKDYAVVTQSIGRVARVCEGKTDPTVYDPVDAFPYLRKMFKKRMTIYHKNDCEVLP